MQVQARLCPHPCFLDYMAVGCRLYLMFAVDFSECNLPAADMNSMHYEEEYDSEEQEGTLCQQALASVADIGHVRMLLLPSVKQGMSLNACQLSWSGSSLQTLLASTRKALRSSSNVSYSPHPYVIEVSSPCSKSAVIVCLIFSVSSAHARFRLMMPVVVSIFSAHACTDLMMPAVVQWRRR